MIKTDLGGVAADALPLEPFKAHLRLADGFDAIPGQAERLDTALRAAFSALEEHLGKVLFRRDFLLKYSGGDQSWDRHTPLVLPFAPVQQLHSARVLRTDGTDVLLALENLRLIDDVHRPSVALTGGDVPVIGPDDEIELQLTAGMAVTWEALPASLLQAMLLLAAPLFEQGSVVPLFSDAVRALIAPYRTLRIGLGGAV